MRRLGLGLGAALLGAAIAIALLVAGSSLASDQSWSAPVALANCGAATQPKVVFPFSAPGMRSGEGAIVWLGSSPDCTDKGSGVTSLDIAALHSDDEPAAPRALMSGAAARTGLAAPLQVAGTTHGQIVAVAAAAGAAVLADGFATSGIDELTSLGGSGAQTATMDGFIGDADVATVTESAGQYGIELFAQRHYASHFGKGYYLSGGPARITALAIGMDFRADRLVIWAQGGEVWARYVTNAGHAKGKQELGPSGYDPQIAAVLSDDDRAFVLWTDEPAPGVSGATSVLLAHSAVGPTFHGTTTLASFTEPAGVRLTAGSVAAERLSSEGVALLWPALADGNYEIESAGATDTGVLAPSVLAEPGEDLRLGAVATGPRNEIVVLAEVAPRTVDGFDQSHQQLLTTRSNEVRDPGGLGFGPLTQLAAAGPNSDPAVAVDPDTDTAVAAWQTTLYGVPAIDWSAGSGS